MFGWTKKKELAPDLPKPSPVNGRLRETLFGDMPWADWLPRANKVVALEPWTSFGKAKQYIDVGDVGNARLVLQEIVARPSFESRIYLQSWQFLKELGVNPPPEQAKDVLGVVLEAGVNGGLDLIAAYADHHARYYNFSGGAVIWEKPNDTLNPLIDDLLGAATKLVKLIGVWEKRRPPAPPEGHARINILTPSGLHFGQGKIDVLSKDPLGKIVFSCGFLLMKALMNLSGKVEGDGSPVRP